VIFFMKNTYFIEKKFGNDGSVKSSPKEEIRIRIIYDLLGVWHEWHGLKVNFRNIP